MFRQARRTSAALFTPLSRGPVDGPRTGPTATATAIAIVTTDTWERRAGRPETVDGKAFVSTEGEGGGGANECRKKRQCADRAAGCGPSRDEGGGGAGWNLVTQTDKRT